MNLVEKAKEHGAKAVGGLTVASVVWIYATFATKSELSEVKQVNAAQWQMISDLKADAKANDAIIRYYFHVPSETSTNK